MPVKIFECSTIGVYGTTAVHVKQIDGCFEARCGIAIMGTTNMTDEEFEACNRDPFSDNFNDNYVVGIGLTEKIAIENLKRDINHLQKILFA